ncbi:MAG TPA: GNAT family N-acetyltransferase, partial [Acidimicrobiales bacterium]
MVEIRAATLDDVGAVVDLHQSVAGEGLWLGTEPPVDRERFAAVFRNAIEADDHTLLVAVEGDRVVGNLGMYPVHAGAVGLGMSITDGYRGRGVGSALVAAAIDWARSRGDVHKIELEVWPHNAAGLRTDDLLSNPKADRLLGQLPAEEFVVFGTGL